MPDLTEVDQGNTVCSIIVLEQNLVYFRPLPLEYLAWYEVILEPYMQRFL
jgi:hypothetical protein